MRHVIGLDFGTTNSAIAVASPTGTTTLATFQEGNHQTTTFRSILYFDAEVRGPDGKPRAVAGPAAITRYLQAETRGRLIQSMKSHLASRLFQETYVFGHRYTLEDLIAMLLRQLRAEAEAQFGDLGKRVVVGRPVHFSGADDARADAFALSRLQAALALVGFEEIVFEFEPVAAAYAHESQLDHDELILIADFGGGTSDFSLMQVGPTVRRRGHTASDILATEGVALAGDAFDSKIVRHLIAPRLGRGSQYRSALNKVLPVPSWLYTNLERWHYLSFLKSKKTMQMLEELRWQAFEPEKIEALIHVIDQDLGYHLYRAVERAKIELSAHDAGRLAFHDDGVTIAETLTRPQFEDWIGEELAAIVGCVDRLLARAGVTAQDVDAVFMTGGSSFVPAVRRLFKAHFGTPRIRSGDELTSVAKGLALRGLDL
ncbi:MAG TPA: Hsp70 family protein [Alphaproteobacteria bacterium]|nr:Hsp70 family protein [Alphaproteobacteria bacterium]